MCYPRKGFWRVDLLLPCYRSSYGESGRGPAPRLWRFLRCREYGLVRSLYPSLVRCQLFLGMFEGVLAPPFPAYLFAAFLIGESTSSCRLLINWYAKAARLRVIRRRVRR